MNIFGWIGWLAPVYFLTDVISDGKLNGQIKFGKKKTAETPPAEKSKGITEETSIPKPGLTESSTFEEKLKALREYYIKTQGQIGENQERELKKIEAERREGAIDILCRQAGLFSKEEILDKKPEPPLDKKPVSTIKFFPQEQALLDKIKERNMDLEAYKANLFERVGKHTERLQKLGKYGADLKTTSSNDQKELKKNKKMYEHLTLWADKELKKIDAEISKLKTASIKKTKEGGVAQKDPKIASLEDTKEKITNYYKNRKAFLKEREAQHNKAVDEHKSWLDQYSRTSKTIEEIEEKSKRPKETGDKSVLEEIPLGGSQEGTEGAPEGGGSESGDVVG